MARARDFLKSPAGQAYAESNPPAKLLWSASDGVNRLNDQLVGLSEHFPEFVLDLRVSNVLFRGFNAKGEPILSMIDQNPRLRPLQPRPP